MRAHSAAAAAVLALLLPTIAHAAPEPGGEGAPREERRLSPPDMGLGYHTPPVHPTLAWAVLQLVPSPEVAIGRQRHTDATGEVSRGATAAAGLRWQLTPALWSFGASRHQPRWRTLMVDPIARHSGSLELSTSFEYIGGRVDRLLVRPGLRVYLPVVQRGEYLSLSLGTSVYAYDGARVAYDVGAHVLGGVVGLRITVAPTHAPLTTIATLELRYF